MDSSKIGVRYAKALFGAAIDAQTLDAVYSDVVALTKLYETEPRIASFFARPLVKINDKIHFVDSVFKSHLNQLTLQFLYLIIRKKREAHLPAMMRNFIDLYRQHKKIKKSKLIVPIPVSDTTKQSVKALLSKHYDDSYVIEMDTEEDPSIIGGFILEIGMIEYDASIKHKLNEIRKTLINASYEAKI